MIAILLLCVYLGPEEDFSLQLFSKDAPSNSLQNLYQYILPIPCSGSDEGVK